MRLGCFVEYRGYIGSIEYSPEDSIYYGHLLDIMDFVNYYADDIMELYKCYRDAVDDYIEFKREIERGDFA